MTVNDEQVTRSAFVGCLSFLYTGCIDVMNDNDLKDTIAAAELLNLPELFNICSNVQKGDKDLNASVAKQFNDCKSEVMRKLFLNKALFSDFTFIVNGQKIPAHCCVLAARSEVMSVMFSGRFAESKTAEVRSCDTIYIYVMLMHMIPNRWKYQESVLMLFWYSYNISTLMIVS